MKVKTIPIASINPAPYNPRVDLRPGDPDYEKLKQSIKTFGYVEPLVWNDNTGTLISGHQRHKILSERAVTEVAVSVVDFSLEKEKALNLALNKIIGRWDDAKLANLLDELGKNPEFDLTLSGFDLPEISEILDRNDNVGEDDVDLGEHLDSSKEPITRLGDIVELGKHRIMCGDSTDRSNVEALMAGQKAGMAMTDPPYRTGYRAEQRPTNNRETPKWSPILNDDLSDSEYAVLLEKSFKNMCEFLAPGSAAYIWNGFAHFGHMHDLLASLDFHVSSVIVWEKPNPSPSFSDYSWQCEFLLYGWLRGNGPHRWYGPMMESNVWKCKRDPAVLLRHPSQKPTELAMRALRNSSQRGDIIFDSYLGSGSVLLAADRLGRKCYGIDLEPRYIDSLAAYYIKTHGRESVPPEVFERYGMAV